MGKQKKFVSSRKKEDFETFLGRKHWKNSNMALAGKDKAATLKKNSEKWIPLFHSLRPVFPLVFQKKLMKHYIAWASWNLHSCCQTIINISSCSFYLKLKSTFFFSKLKFSKCTRRPNTKSFDFYSAKKWDNNKGKQRGTFKFRSLSPALNSTFEKFHNVGFVNITPRNLL